MRDPYLYEDCTVLKNLLGFKTQAQLDEAEADFVVYRLKKLILDPFPGNFDFFHLLQTHKYIFQDIYPWAGQIRTIDIVKEEPALGGLSIQYSSATAIENDVNDALEILHESYKNRANITGLASDFANSLASLWKVHPFREGNTRTILTFCCLYAEKQGLSIDRELFEKNSQYVRTALVAYNAKFDDLGDLSKKEYLERIVHDAFARKV